MGGVVTANMAMDWSDLKLDKNVDERLVVDCWATTALTDTGGRGCGRGGRGWTRLLHATAQQEEAGMEGETCDWCKNVHPWVCERVWVTISEGEDVKALPLW